MNKTKLVLFLASASLALAFTLGCSSDDNDENSSSSGIVQSSSSIVECLDYNSETHFCDTRDGKTYGYVTMGNQIWMAENLNYDILKGNRNCMEAQLSACGGGCSSEPDPSVCYIQQTLCYDNNPNNCDKYGRLYLETDKNEACPEGWHLPSKAEFNTLNDFIENDDDWKNFILPSGYGYCNCGYDCIFEDHIEEKCTFSGIEEESYYWIERSNSYEVIISLFYSDYISPFPYVTFLGTRYGDISSIRCIKD